MMERDEFLGVLAVSAYAGFLSYGMGFVFLDNEHEWGYIPFHVMPEAYRDYDPDFEVMVMERQPNGGGKMYRVKCLEIGMEPPFVISARCADGMGVPRLSLKELQRQANISRWLDELA